MIEEQIKEITERNLPPRETVDELLRLDASNVDLGLGATKSQKSRSKSNSRKIYNAIKPYDYDTWKLLTKMMDK